MFDLFCSFLKRGSDLMSKYTFLCLFVFRPHLEVFRAYSWLGSSLSEPWETYERLLNSNLASALFFAVSFWPPVTLCVKYNTWREMIWEILKKLRYLGLLFHFSANSDQNHVTTSKSWFHTLLGNAVEFLFYCTLKVWGKWD